MRSSVDCRFLMMAKPRQLHIWLSDPDYEFLKHYAEQRGESLGVIVRRMVRALEHTHPQLPASPSRDGKHRQARGVLTSGC